jgi:succinyl-CoA synthetase beta subunit
MGGNRERRREKRGEKLERKNEKGRGKNSPLRGKNSGGKPFRNLLHSDLVGLNLDVQAAEAFVRERMGRQLTMNNVTGSLTTFIVEPFVPHDAEFYLSIQSVRSGIDLSFSDAGGVEIEDNWDKVRTVHLPATADAPPGACASADALAPLLAGLASDARPAMAAFVAGCVAVFEDLDFTLMEMNPFTFDPSTGKPFPLDMRGELDDTAAFRSAKKWGSGDCPLEFPLPFGRELSGAEAAIAAMDASTGASLKFSVLNPVSEEGKERQSLTKTSKKLGNSKKTRTFKKNSKNLFFFEFRKKTARPCLDDGGRWRGLGDLRGHGRGPRLRRGGKEIEDRSRERRRAEKR